MNTTEILDKVSELAVTYGTKIIGAIIVWIVGSWVLKYIVRFFNKTLDKRNVDVTLKPFLKGLVGTLLKALLVITVLSMLGIEMTSFIAVLGAAGLAIGMALSGTLQNFAAGVMLLIFKPFRVGDFITVGDHSGTVKEIQIFNTILETLEHHIVTVPNSVTSNSSVTNYTSKPYRRVDWTVGMAYGDDLAMAKEVLKAICDADDRILKEPETVFVAVEALADSSVNFTVRAWVKNENYWPVYFRLNEEVYQKFGPSGLHIPFPQMDVHVHQS